MDAPNNPPMTEGQYNRFASRKFILCLFGILLSSGLLYLDQIDPEVWKSVFNVCVLGYLAGNVSQEVIAKLLNK